MKRWPILLIIGLAAAAVPLTAAQEPGVRRNQGGTINLAPPPAVYTVVAVDGYNRTLRLRSRNGGQADVHVDDAVYDVATLKPGDRVRVDFLVPNDGDRRLAAANVWPVR
jgi:hypothetical protein